MAESFQQLAFMGLISDPLASRMKKDVGFRNIAVHAYQRINWKIMYAIITSHLDDFRASADAITRAAGLQEA